MQWRHGSANLKSRNSEIRDLESDSDRNLRVAFRRLNTRQIEVSSHLKLLATRKSAYGPNKSIFFRHVFHRPHGSAELRAVYIAGHWHYDFYVMSRASLLELAYRLNEEQTPT